MSWWPHVPQLSRELSMCSLRRKGMGLTGGRYCENPSLGNTWREQRTQQTCTNGEHTRTDRATYAPFGEVGWRGWKVVSFRG